MFTSTSCNTRARLCAVGNQPAPAPVVVACHACSHLSLQIVQLASAQSHASAIAVMPCCHSKQTTGPKFKAAADALGMPLGVFIDIALFGALGARGYTAQLKLVKECSATSNRLVIGQRVSPSTPDTPPSTPVLWPSLDEGKTSSASSKGGGGAVAQTLASEDRLRKAYVRVHLARTPGTVNICFM